MLTTSYVPTNLQDEDSKCVGRAISATPEALPRRTQMRVLSQSCWLQMTPGTPDTVRMPPRRRRLAAGAVR